jgi:hypothetical protein
MSDAAKELLEAGFSLGGSRRMAQKFPQQVVISEDTDYDLYCPNEPKYTALLRNKGFYEIDAQYRNYWDNMLVGIWKSDAHPECEVLVRKDVQKYSEAFELISADMYVKYLWKSAPCRDSDVAEPIFKEQVKRFFNSLFRLVGYVEPNDFNLDDLPF